VSLPNRPRDERDLVPVASAARACAVTPRGRLPRRVSTALCVALLGAACDREKPAAAPPAPPAAAPTPAPVVPDPAPAAAPTVGWDADAGLALVVPSAEGGALLVTPGAADAAGTDTAGAGARPTLPTEVVLFAEHGLVGSARANMAGAAGEGCAEWPRVRLGPTSGADALPEWKVGFAGAPGAEPPVALPLDSMDALAGPDSAALAASLTRLASALPAPTGVSAATRAALRGVPFRVRRARSFSPDARTRAVVAVLTRTMNQEASPAADAVLLVAERPANAGAERWRTAYSERSAGHEETLPAVDVLAAVRLDGAGDPRAALVVAREDDAGVRSGLLERAAPGEWKRRWTSARVGCGS